MLLIFSMMILGVVALAGMTFFLITPKYGTDTQLVVQSNQETLTNANLQSDLTGYLLVKDVFHYINIRNQAMYEFLTTYIRSFLWMFIYIGIGLLILGILSAMLSEKSRLELTR
ncbi:MAG: hypothetical protein ACTIDP_10815 [Lactococcus cremoris]